MVVLLEDGNAVLVMDEDGTVDCRSLEVINGAGVNVATIDVGGRLTGVITGCTTDGVGTEATTGMLAATGCSSLSN